MGKKIFVSYKYGDTNVEELTDRSLVDRILDPIKARHYVDELQSLMDKEDHINKGENDDESLEGFKDSTIASKLRDKIWDSSITIVLISPNMKESGEDEGEQWIPWEISYSLKEHSRNERTSRSNGVLAIVLPDNNGSYSYFIREDVCSHCNCRILQTDKTFSIIAKNMFNKKELQESDCSEYHNGSKIYSGESSYIKTVKWKDFVESPAIWLDTVEQLQQNISDYNIVKAV